MTRVGLRRSAGFAAAGLVLMAAACRVGGSSAPLPPIPSSCTPTGSTLKITAKGIAFSPTFLCAQANQASTIAFDNEDPAIPHNIDVFSDARMTKPVFRGEIISGPKMADYALPALPPGAYRFRCALHPTQMTGILLVTGP